MKKIILIIVFILFLISAISAICCEKTKEGAWCQDATTEDDCDTSGDLKAVPTSCEATSYCSLGCCYDSQGGTCMENTPENVCNSGGGVWDSSSDCSIPQCELGCCLIGDQAAFVTQTRCKSLSAAYGLETNFRTDISSEIECIASAKADAKGACVFEEELQNKCRFISQGSCSEMQEAEFHANILCTNFELNTNCEKSKKTTCVEGLDEVFFVDTCGNLANIYDSSRADDQTYWDQILSWEESCGAGSSNSNSASCGNCNYYLGSTCGTSKRGEETAPIFGENICKDLGCEYEGINYAHGETWCSDVRSTNNIVSGTALQTDSLKNNLPGAEYSRLICYNGEVQVESCSAFRSEVCIESQTSTDFRTAACRINRWQNCIDQESILDCENSDQRDCKWISTEWNPVEGDNTGIFIQDPDTKINGTCVPMYSPGLDFWGESTDAGSICGLASTQCSRTYVKYGVGGKDKETRNEYCGSNGWEDEMKNVCSSLGDCGSTTNYLGSNSYADWDSSFIENAGEEEE